MRADRSLAASRRSQPGAGVMVRHTPDQVGAEAGRQWAEQLASFEQLGALALEYENGLAPLFNPAFVEAALAVLAEAARDFVDLAAPGDEALAR